MRVRVSTGRSHAGAGRARIPWRTDGIGHRGMHTLRLIGQQQRRRSICLNSFYSINPMKTMVNHLASCTQCRTDRFHVRCATCWPLISARHCTHILLTRACLRACMPVCVTGACGCLSRYLIVCPSRDGWGFEYIPEWSGRCNMRAGDGCFLVHHQYISNITYILFGHTVRAD